MSTFDVKVISPVSSGVVDTSLLFGAIGGQTDASPVPIIASALYSYINTKGITILGTITTGVWQGSVIDSSHGGTGENNAGNTISIGGNLAFSGAFTTTITVTANTTVTLPTTGTLITSTVTTLSNLVSIGTITTGVWNGTTIAIANGGTGATSATAAFTALSPITTQGDIIIGQAGGAPGRLAIGANTYVLTSNGTTAGWSAPFGAATAVSGAAVTISSSSDGSSNIGHRISVSINGTTYYIPCSSVAF